MSRKLFLIPLFLLAVSVFLAGGMPAPVQAQEVGAEAAGGVLQIDGLQTPSNPDVAWNGSCNKFLVVYDRKRTSTDYNIWGRYVSDSGLVLGAGPFQITTNTARQVNPAVAYNVGAGNNYLVAWEDYRDGHWEIYAQLWNCMKQSANAAVRITPNDAAHQLNPDVICGYNPAGCWVVWNDFRNGQWEIYGQWLNVAGALVGGNVRITNNASTQRYPAITRNPENTSCAPQSFMVVWQDSRNAVKTGTDIYAQQLDNVGPCGGGNKPVITNIKNQMYPDLAYGTNNHAYQVVWEDYRNVNADIYARRLNGNGAWIGGDFALSNPASTQSRPAVCYDANTLNQFNTVWYDNRAGNTDIYGQRSGGAGELVGTPAGVNYLIVASANNEIRPAIAYSSVSDHYFVVWADGVDGIEGKAVWWP